MCLSSDIFVKLKNAVIDGDVDEASSLAGEVLNSGVDPLEAIRRGLNVGIKEVGDKFGNMEIFLPELMMSGEAMKVAVNILKRGIPKKSVVSLGKIVFGTVEGDIHSIGKNIVVTLLEAAGFDVYDLGENVPVETFIRKVKELKPDLLGLSALMTTTVTCQRDVIEQLKAENLRGGVKVIVGGAPTTPKWAEEIGADGWAENASVAVQKVKELLEVGG